MDRNGENQTMKLLAFDTSSPKLSVCWYENDRCLHHAVEERSIRHSSALMPLIASVCRSKTSKARRPDVLAVGIGPGSFTGLRVGVMTANMLGALWNIPLVGVSSLEAMARIRSRGKDGQYAVYLDARKQKVYAALYEKKGSQWKVLMEPYLTEKPVFFSKISSDAVKLGDGEADGAGPAALLAKGVAESAIETMRKKRKASTTLLTPLYLHPKDCNVTIGKK